MKRFIYYGLFAIVMICHSCRRESTEMIIVKSLDLKYDIPGRLNCESFLHYFKDQIQIDTIRNVGFINNFSHLVSKLIVDKENNFPNVRYVIEIYNNHGVTVLCGDSIRCSLNSRPMLPNEKLNEFVFELLERQSFRK